MGTCEQADEPYVFPRGNTYGASRATITRIGVIGWLLLAGCRPSASPSLTAPSSALPSAAASTSKESQRSATENSIGTVSDGEIIARTRQFVPAFLTAEISGLPSSERQALASLIAAARGLEPIFDRQAYAKNPELRERLQGDKSSAGRAKLRYFEIMRGPWDRQDRFRPFAVNFERPQGGGFYPEDLTKNEYERWLASHPAQRQAFESLTTVIVRKEKALQALPYREFYADWLRPVARDLLTAASLTANSTLKKFLTSRAAALESDDYYASDKDWMDVDSPVEITIGPYETYEDAFLGLKGAFGAYVTIRDPSASAKLANYEKLLPLMEKDLPIPSDARAKRGGESPIEVADVVFASGDARKSVQTTAFNLPNDERVRAEKGAKKVLLRNVIETKFDHILRPIAARVLDSSLLPMLSATAFFQATLFHELAHSLGPAFTKKNGRDVEVRVALESTFAPLEECKADAMGAYNLLYLTKHGEFPARFRDELLTSYFVSLFRSARFGVVDAHGRGAAVQINRYLEESAARFDSASARFSIDLPRLEKAMRSLVHDVCMLQHLGDKVAAEALLEKYGVVSQPIRQAIAVLDDIPVDIAPIYTLAGEK